MDLNEAIDLIRVECNDPVFDGDDSGSLWSTEELSEYFTQAEEEYCKLSFVLVDSRTPEVCRVAIDPVSADHPSYPLSDRIVHIHRVWMESDPRKYALFATSAEELDFKNPGWRAMTTKKPNRYMLGETEGWIDFVAQPTEAGVVGLKVSRLPLQRAVDAGDFEIPEMHRMNLFDYVKYKMYSKEDADAFDSGKASSHLGTFLAVAGEAKARVMRKRNRTRTVRYGGP